MDENTQQEEKQGGIQGGQSTQAWKVTDEEIDRVIKKLEEGWGW